ncbi:MAG: discoidin domain-containing protein [Candidatus Berkelbacteria bacterium]|nr:discoidin domain-containing protein [Candidatus Berkelbacteria bacterium]
MKNKVLRFVIIIVLVVAFVPGVQYFWKSKQKIAVHASNASQILSSSSDWSAGVSSNIESSSGSLNISQLPPPKIDTSGMTVTASKFDSTKLNLVDANLSTAFMGTTGDPFYWQIDFGGNRQLSCVYFYEFVGSSIGDVSIYGSTNETDWTAIYEHFPGGPDGLWHCGGCGSANMTYRYVRISVTPAYSTSLFFDEIEFYPPTAPGTHTTAATQIDGGTNFWQWQTFTPTETVPANTAVTYRFRSSVNGTDWTDPWSAVQTPTSGNALDISGLVTSRSGETKYRYLQVETTLSRSDNGNDLRHCFDGPGSEIPCPPTIGPSVDSYSIGYHTEQKPNKPVAQTAVIQ